jgi:hypothetical protein
VGTEMKATNVVAMRRPAAVPRQLGCLRAKKEQRQTA